MTGKQVARRMAARERIVEQEFRSTARGVALAAVRFTKERLTAEVYAIPEDVTKSGKKKWQRTGLLRSSEVAEFPNPYEIVLKNTAPYAYPRHEAGKPGHRRINPLRESHWRDELVETFRETLVDLYHQTMTAILKRTAD